MEGNNRNVEKPKKKGGEKMNFLVVKSSSLPSSSLNMFDLRTKNQ